MKQLTANVFIETELKGANHGLVTTSDGIVLIDTPHKPSDAMRLKGEISRHGRLRYSHSAPEESADIVSLRVSAIGRGQAAVS